MEIIKEHSSDYFKDIVTMKSGCGHKDYYGCFVMRDGLNYCRSCIYEIWQKENDYKGWKPNPKKDFVFPLYKDGIDYIK